jgi:hypothetical protein
MNIWAKAKSLFKNLNAIDPDMKVSLFAAIATWFEHLP